MGQLEVRSIRKAFGRHIAVDEVSLHVEPGEVLGLLGPNGAGKSTTLMIACGLLKPDRGSILINGRKLQPGDRGLRKKIGVVPQELAIYPELTAIENLRFFGRLYGLRGGYLRLRVSELLERTGLTARAHDRVEEFSGGMKRRLNFGVALIHNPEIVILDEPTVGVDPQSRTHLLDSIRQLREDGVAVIYASHYMEEVQTISDRVAIIDHGQVIADGSLSHLLRQLRSHIKLHVYEDGTALPEPILSGTEMESVAVGQKSILIDRANPQVEDYLAETLASILDDVREAGAKLDRIDVAEPNLEHLFLELTGNRLRE
ncbi:ABC transporter ATP-binding protein [Calycomorphotria hydatis]|uniref:Daunorubicin/doxorubicin resistance ATP-binding protein DrrA n=1 Tax=Calycomorphotria hydatis TaxID=2528027 RepID=A0A517TBB5_9PLAN|nr:ABC transporter ATP-binding protein [Calycomorphotria hydatis]QDT65671.1 Daunorubicin/doxorubicin resistance ATP-binding protein DrrA [Calycomorphotria hydatis]